MVNPMSEIDLTTQPCTLVPIGGSAIGAPCPACGHTSVVHPGPQNPALTACVICTLLAR